MQSRGLLIVWIISFLLVSCSALSSGSPTPMPTPTPKPTHTPTPTHTPQPTPTPTATPVAAQLESIRISATILPQAHAERWSRERFVIEIEVENLEAEQQVVDVTARCSDSFLFVTLDREPNQQFVESEHEIIQKEVILAPQVSDQPSYKRVYFGFVQAEDVIAGTHNFVVQANLPDKDPIRVSVVFEVSGKYILGTPTPTP